MTEIICTVGTLCYGAKQGVLEVSLLMSEFPRKTLILFVLVAATTYAFAQMPPSHGPMNMHEQMQHGGTMNQSHQHMMQGQGSGSANVPTMPGQDAFGAIQEIVQMLEADPSTDWSKVNINALREHLIDMNEVTLHAAAVEHSLKNGIEIDITGEGRTREAIRRMVPSNAAELSKLGWNAKSEDLPNGVKFTVTTDDPKQVVKLKALGFLGIMVQGTHHQPHHLMMATGEMHVH